MTSDEAAVASAHAKPRKAPPASITLPREQEAQRIISKYMGWGAGSGVLPVPVLDIVGVGAVQVLMVKDLLALYDSPFEEARIRTIVTVLIGSLSPTALAGAVALTVIKVVPVIGYPLAGLTMPALASAATYAVGQVVAGHLGAGGTLANFSPSAMTKPLRAAFAEGKAKVKAATHAAATAHA